MNKRKCWEVIKMYFLLWEVVVAAVALIGNKVMKNLEPDNKWYTLTVWLIAIGISLYDVIYC